MKESLPPEERLLRLIRGEKKPKAQGAGPVHGHRPAAGLSLPDEKFSSAGFTGLKKYFSYPYLKKITVIIFFLSLAYLLSVFIYPLKKITLPEVVPQQAAGQPETGPAKEVKPLQFYLERIKGRAIFNSGPDARQAVAVSNVSVDSIKDIKVVGIISGEKIQAVIEDTKLNKTYSVTKGQTIGEMQIEEITEGKVVISYHGKLFEFSL